MSERREVIVIGATGLLGTAVACQLKTRWIVRGSHFENASRETFLYDLGTGDPSTLPIDWKAQRAVVIAGGVTSRSACAAAPEETSAVNVTGVARIASHAAGSGAAVIYLSSDAVFAGDSTGTPRPKRECDEASPTSEYGRQKLAAEVEITKVDGLVLRLTKVSDVFVASTVAQLRDEQPVRAASDQFLSLISAGDVARVTEFALEASLRGCYHLAVAPARTRFDWCVRIAHAYGLQPSLIESCSIAEFDDPARGERMPRDSTLDGARLAEILPFALQNGDEQTAGPRSEYDQSC